MTGSAHKLPRCRWRIMRVLAVLAWVTMVSMPVMMPAHASSMAVADADTAAMQHDMGTPDHSRLMAGCCQGGPNQHTSDHGCHCAATCSAGVVLPVTNLIGEPRPTLLEWHIIEPAVASQSSIPPHRPPRA